MTTLSLGDQIREKFGLTPQKYSPSIFQENKEFRQFILSNMTDLQASALLNRVNNLNGGSNAIQWVEFNGKVYLTPSGVGEVLEISTNTPKSYMASYRDEMKVLGARVCTGNELKDFFYSAAQGTNPGCSSMGIYTPLSIVLIGMVAKRPYRCQKLQAFLAAELGLTNVKQKENEADQLNLIPDGSGKSLYEVFGDDDDSGIESIASILERNASELLVSSELQKISVPIIEGLMINGVVYGHASADDILDLFTKYETHLTEGVQGVFYCNSCHPNARLVVELLEQAGYSVRLVLMDEAENQ